MSGFSVSNLASQVQNYFVETRDYFRIQTHPKKTEIVVKTITVAILAGLISNLSPLGRFLFIEACIVCAFVVFTRCPDILDSRPLSVIERTAPLNEGLEKARSMIEGIKDVFKPPSLSKSVDQASRKARLMFKEFIESISDALTSES